MTRILPGYTIKSRTQQGCGGGRIRLQCLVWEHRGERSLALQSIKGSRQITLIKIRCRRNVREVKKTGRRNIWNLPVRIELNAYATRVVAIAERGSSSPIWSAMLFAMMWKNGYAVAESTVIRMQRNIRTTTSIIILPLAPAKPDPPSV